MRSGRCVSWGGVLGLVGVMLAGCDTQKDRKSSASPVAPQAAEAAHDSGPVTAVAETTPASPLPEVAAPGGQQHSDPAPSGSTQSTSTPSDSHAPGVPASATDPVSKNGPIFVDWPKPKLAIVFSGLQKGYLEPCGCAGLENQKGGISRRHSLFKQLESQGWPVAAFDIGGQIRRYGRQAEIQLGIAIESLRTMKYDAVALGTGELRVPTNELLANTANLADDSGRSRFVSANVAIFGFEADATPRFCVVDTPAGKIGVTAILGDSFRPSITNQELEIQPAAEALTRVWPELKKASDIRILLAHATNDEAIALAKKFAEFDIVVSAGGADEPPAAALPIEGTRTMLVDVGHKGMYAIVLGRYDDPKTPWRYQRVPLDSRFASSPEMKQLMTAYQGQLEQEGFTGLGLRPLRHPLAKEPGDPLTRFAGSASCQECHKQAFEIFRETPHAHATETLSKLDPPRHFDPECLSCHVTGWNAQEFQPYDGGFAGLEATPLLVGNGCENCHGPAAAHVAAEKAKQADGASLRDELRKRLVLVKNEESCEACHDHDNSPDFDIDTYWPQVEHHGKN